MGDVKPPNPNSTIYMEPWYAYSWFVWASVLFGGVPYMVPSSKNTFMEMVVIM